MTELRETDRSLLEMSVTIPVARLRRAARAQQLGLSTAEPGDQPIMTVTRSEGAKTVEHTMDVDFPLRPRAVAQVGSLSRRPWSPRIRNFSGNMLWTMPADERPELRTIGLLRYGS